MIIVNHRQNSIEQLKQTSANFGVEIDVRNHGDKLYVVHDPFDSNVCKFSDWLDYFHHRFLIINVKEEGLEESIFKLLNDRKISNFFILDESFPYIRKYALLGFSQFAIRISEYESHITALNFSKFLSSLHKKVEWIWVDSFTGITPDSRVIYDLKNLGYKLCYVSPELHCSNSPALWEHKINFFIEIFDKNSIPFPDMICTKLPKIWSNFNK